MQCFKRRSEDRNAFLTSSATKLHSFLFGTNMLADSLASTLSFLVSQWCDALGQSMSSQVAEANNFCHFCFRPSRGWKRGRGIAYYVEATAGMPEESAAIRFEDDGMVSIFVGTQSNGQGHETAFTQIVSDRLGLDAERIQIIMGDTDAIPTGGGTGGSRSLVSTGTAINKMSDTVIDKGKAAAAELFETSAVDIEFGEGNFRVVGTDRAIDIVDLAEKAKEMALAGQIETLDTRETTALNPITYPNGCHVAEIEVDPATGRVNIDRWSVVDDFGRVVNPLFVESQVHGGLGADRVPVGTPYFLHYYPPEMRETFQVVAGHFDWRIFAQLKSPALSWL